jgi:hypothetical protein
VAYFGKGADKLLPIGRGSCLVVDASDEAVKSGQTCPASLLRLLKKGVRIYSSERLHSKVFVFGRRAFVGSANVSKNSRDKLAEALISTRDQRTIILARQFVRDHCLLSIGPEELKRLSKIYRPPKEGGSNRQSNSQTRLRIVRLSPYELPTSRERRYNRSEKEANKKIDNNTHQIFDFYWVAKHTFYEGEVILPIQKDAAGIHYVFPPGKVISISQFEDGLGYPTMVMLEIPKRRRMKLSKLIRRAGSRCKATLEKGRILHDAALVGRLSDIFRPPSN